jgi:hypothetical protein
MIVAAAIKHKETGVAISLPRPARHHHVMHAMYDIVEKTIGGSYEQGFMTQDGVFVDRYDGFIIAQKYSQIREKHGPANYLFSEDMW